MLATPTLTPAYGRDYHSEADVLKALGAGEDFVFHNIMSRWDGSYCNLEDLRKAGYPEVCVRFNKLRGVIVVKLESISTPVPEAAK